jgi:threonine/homoserine/homoserine lactone efflux protein
VLLQSIGQMLPAALAVTLSPFPIIAIVLLLATPKGRRNGVAFTAGWVLALTVLTVVAVVLFRDTDEADSTSSALLDWLRVAAGSVMIVLGVKKWRTRPRRGDEIVLPKWMASLTSIEPLRAFGLGCVLAGVNPKNLALTMAAMGGVDELGATGSDLVVASIVFVILGSASVLAAVIVHVAGGARAAGWLESVKQFMLANNAVIMMVVLLILGANILGSGLSGLGR